MEEKKEKKKKKGPGRPPKNKPKSPKIILGIQNSPVYSEYNDIELIYSEPFIMKKIFSFIIGQTDTIHCNFKKDKFNILCKDKYNSNQIKITLHGKGLQRYYCKQELNIGLSVSYLEPLNKKLGKQFDEFVWFSEKFDKDKFTYIYIKRVSYKDSWNQTKYNLVGNYEFIDEKIFDDYNLDDYPLSFQLQTKIFKDIITDANNHKSTKIYIRQNGKNSPLIIEYTPECGRYKTYNPFKNLEEIKLKSNIGVDESFSVAILVDRLKPISSIIPSDTIEFKLSKTKKVIMTAKLDNSVIEITILTEIVLNNESFNK